MVQLSKEYIEVSRTEMPEHLVSNYIVELPPAWRNTERTANLAKGPLQSKVDLRLTNTQPLTEDRGSAVRSCGARGTGSLMYSLNNTDTGLRTVSECCTADSFSGQGGDKFSEVRSIVLVGPISLISWGPGCTSRSPRWREATRRRIGCTIASRGCCSRGQTQKQRR